MYDIKNFETYLSKKLEEFCPNSEFRDVLAYSVLPAGKLFRPNLVLQTAKDLGEIKEEHLSLAAAVELHHTYTLIHDDLPAMDDDETRRGRPSSHIKYNEWKAILAGDALLNASFEILSELSPNRIKPVLKSFGQYCGANGLILGQYKDLNQENQKLEDILKIHELKTSRLIQCCLYNSALISENQNIADELHKLGHSLGINFQLLDDLCELTDDINQHEKDINPFFHFDKNELINIIKANNTSINKTLEKFKLVNLKEYIGLYLNKSQKIIHEGSDKIESHLGFKVSL